jgi:hypothetical protein
MKHEDPLFTALSELPLPPVPTELSARVRREAHAELLRASARQAAGAPSLRRPRWLELALSSLACGVAVAQAGWAIAFVTALYQ